MSHGNSTSPPNRPAQRANRSARATVGLLLLVAFACLGPTACGSSESPAAAAAAARSTKLYQQERTEALNLVHCARGRGIPLPDPNAQNGVSTVGIDLKSRRRKAALTFCYQKAVKTAAKELEAERVREGKPAKAATAQTPAQGPSTFQRERAQLIEVVRCARRHGIDLPEPNAHNNIDTHGFHLRSHRNNLVMSACFRAVVGRASREQEAQARAQQAGPPRLGEAPTE